MKRIVLKIAFSGKILYDRNEGARTALKAPPHKAFMPFLQGSFQDGAPYGTKLELPASIDQLADWGDQLKPFHKDMLAIVEGGYDE